MPNCPTCGVMLTFILQGSQCDRCGRYFTVDETVALPGYSDDVMVLNYEILRVIEDLGFPPDTTFRVYSCPGGYAIEPVLAPVGRRFFSVN